MANPAVRISEFPQDDRVWRIDWLAAVQRNDNVPTESTIEVYLRPVEMPRTKANFGVEIKERVCCLIGVGQFPLLVIGSLWHKGRLMVERAVEEDKGLNNVQVNSNTVKLITAGHKHNEQYVINKGHFDVGGYKNGLSANCLAVEYNGDPFGIIIPVAEVIRFYYASSSALSKIAFSGMYKHDFDAMVGESFHFDPELNLFSIHLRKWIEDSDGWTLGRLLQEPCADKAFKLIHSSLAKQSINSAYNKPMPETKFPFEGTTNWTARCLSFKSSGQTRLLVLELMCCTAPFPFENLVVTRDNDGTQANPETDIDDDEKIECWASKPPKLSDDVKLPLQSQSEPYQFAQIHKITLPSNRFAALVGKKIIKTQKTECTHKSAKLTPSVADVATGLGTGTGTSGDSTIIPVSINTTPNDEDKVRRQREKALPVSFDTMIEAVEHLNRYPNIKASIREFASCQSIPLIKPACSRQWSYLDSKKRQLRAVLVVEIQVEERMFWLIEFQQRKGEHFNSALVEVAAKTADKELLLILRGLANANGIWKNIKKSKFEIMTLKHVWVSAAGYAEAVLQKVS